MLKSNHKLISYNVYMYSMQCIWFAIWFAIDFATVHKYLFLQHIIL